jgi:hypothetical protein
MIYENEYEKNRVLYQKSLEKCIPVIASVPSFGVNIKISV